MQTPEIQSIDHIVMQASNLAATIKFYTEILGMDNSPISATNTAASAPVFAFRIAKDQFA